MGQTPGVVDIVAHRGFSSRWPEMTRAAYVEAIAWARAEQVELALECDVQWCADDKLICLHDETVDRTSNGRGPAYAMTLKELRALDFGCGRGGEGSRLVTLSELLDLVEQARADGVRVTVAIETKHPNPRGTDTEQRVAEELAARGWTGPDAPVRLMSFNVEALEVAARLLPAVSRTFLIEQDLRAWADGRLPAGARVCGLDLALLKDDPAYVARARRRGNGVNVWTVNDPADIDFCLDLGVAGVTTDCPDRVLAAIRASGRD
jgi:glycerophosphoryl diester phosphodiesterase